MPDDTTTDASDRGIARRTMLSGAAAGVAGVAFAGSASATPNVVTFRSTSEEVFRYRIRVSGEIRRGGPYESDSGDEFLDARTVEGAASEGRADSFRFSGEIRELDLTGPGKVFVNGDLIRDNTGRLPNRVEIRSTGRDADYEFRVSGRVRKGDHADRGDTVDGNVVRGAVAGGGRDDYRYSGAIAFDATDDPVTVTLELNRG
ncbi:hypothetical protein [Halorussus marinus]|uniref:hypothetical protein n=1 Tax=Halorussus marinus TaxID=2505976 RepID=UPI00106E6A37|nr:hypothetical protein [Halorussus marinus]